MRGMILRVGTIEDARVVAYVLKFGPIGHCGAGGGRLTVGAAERVDISWFLTPLQTHDRPNQVCSRFQSQFLLGFLKLRLACLLQFL